MTYQLLVSTMRRDDFRIVKEMNIQSDAIIVNQCERHSYDTIAVGNSKIQMYSFAERGVGLSRNSALMRATADIVEFADDDMVFTDTYKEDVLREFEQHPEADAILFSVDSLNPNRPLLKIREFGQVSKIEALKYGCARLAVRRDRIIYNNITFSLLFGGGATYGSGEDTVFLQDCLRAGLKIYRSPVKIADVSQNTSSWFEGYTERYYFDKGALFAAALPRLCYLYAMINTVKSKPNGLSRKKIYKLYLQGIKEFKKYRGSK